MITSEYKFKAGDQVPAWIFKCDKPEYQQYLIFTQDVKVLSKSHCDNEYKVEVYDFSGGGTVINFSLKTDEKIVFYGAPTLIRPNYYYPTGVTYLRSIYEYNCETIKYSRDYAGSVELNPN